MMADIAICYLIVGLLISTGIAVRYPRNTRAKLAGYEFKTQLGAKIAMYLFVLLVWPAALLFGEFE